MRNRGGVSGGGDGAPSASPKKKKPGRGGAGPAQHPGGAPPSPPSSTRPSVPLFSSSDDDDDEGDGGGAASSSSFVRRDVDVDVDFDIDADDDGDDADDDESSLRGGTGVLAAGAGGGGGADEGGGGRRRRIATMTTTTTTTRRRRRRSRFLRNLADDLAERGRALWTEVFAIHASATLVYSYHNVGRADVQVAIMTVIALAGYIEQQQQQQQQQRLVIAASIGAFVGGQSVIGSSASTAGEGEGEGGGGGGGGALDDGSVYDDYTVHPGNYMWLLLLSATTGCVWRLVIDEPNIALLSGYAGRLGSATFVGMNVVMMTAYGPAGVVDWDRYYGGFALSDHHIGEAEDAPSLPSSSSSHASSSTSSSQWWRASWDWTEEAGSQVASYVLGTVWLGVLAGGARVLHERRRLSRMIDGGGDAASSPSSSSPSPPTKPPLNNVVVPAVFALSSMLAAYCVPRYEPRARSALFNGLAVGSYVAMASLQRISTISRFASVSLVASVWGLALTPFFVGFAGSE